ncbi:unnamed protein product, partial [Amoebophrya sp. A25]
AWRLALFAAYSQLREIPSRERELDGFRCVALVNQIFVLAEKAAGSESNMHSRSEYLAFLRGGDGGDNILRVAWLKRLKTLTSDP